MLSQREKDKKKSHCATIAKWCAHILNASGSSGFPPLHPGAIGIRKGSEKGDRDNQMLPALQLLKSWNICEFMKGDEVKEREQEPLQVKHSTQ